MPGFDPGLWLWEGFPLPSVLWFMEKKYYEWTPTNTQKKKLLQILISMEVSLFSIYPHSRIFSYILSHRMLKFFLSCILCHGFSESGTLYCDRSQQDRLHVHQQLIFGVQQLSIPQFNVIMLRFKKISVLYILL